LSKNQEFCTFTNLFQQISQFAASLGKFSKKRENIRKNQKGSGQPDPSAQKSTQKVC